MKRFLFWIALAVFLGSCSNDDDSGANTNDGITLSVEDQTITINENPEEGAILTQIQAQSNLDEFAYELEHVTIEDAIVLDRDTGEVIVNDASLFNFELHQEMRFNIRVSVQQRIERAVLTIRITNLDPEGEFRGYVDLTSQERVDFFGSNNYQSISRNLTIGGPVPDGETPITTLLPLQALTRVGGHLTIENADELPNLNGLEGLEFVEDNLVIENNDVLNDLTQLSNLTVADDFIIKRNHNFVHLQGPENLSVGRTLQITECSGLLSIQGFAGNAQIEGLTIDLNAFLTNIDAFGNLETLSGELQIINNPNLMDLDFLENLRQVGSHASIHKNPMATSIVLPSLESVQGDFSIASNLAVTSIIGLEGLTHVGGNFQVVNNSNFGDFCVFTNLIENEGIQQNYIVSGNSFNPSQQDILDGNCSL